MIASTPKRQQLDLSHARHTPLSNEEIINLCIRVQAGDIEARDRMINSNLKFVVKVANKYRGQGVPVSDLINEGVFGLIKAAERFDAHRKVRFASFAIWWIRQAIGTALHDQNTGIKAPSYSQLTRALKLANENRNKPNLSEFDIARLDNLIEASQNRIEALSRIRNPKSLNEMAEKGFDPEGDFESPEENINREELARIVEKIISKLNEKDKILIRRYYGLNGHKNTLQEIADHIGVSRQRVDQRKARILMDLRKTVKQFAA